jgi:hypothetical protein
MVSAAEKQELFGEDDDFFSKSKAKAGQEPKPKGAPEVNDSETSGGDDAIPPEKDAPSSPAGKLEADKSASGKLAVQPVRRAPRKAPPQPPQQSKAEEKPSAADTSTKGKKEGVKVVVPQPKKKAHIPMTPVEKMVSYMRNKGGKPQDVPAVNHLLRGHGGEKVAIKDVAIFEAEPEDEALKEVWKSCPLKNRVNLSASIDPKQVRKIGAEIFQADRMFTQVQVARIDGEGKMECTSGRHRLAFLALVYGSDVKIPMEVMDMSLNEARKAVKAANEARKINAMENMEHTIVTAVNGDIGVAQEDMYAKSVTNKVNAVKYAIYSIMYRDYPQALGFKVTLRGKGGLTTVNNIKDFLTLFLEWDKGMTVEEFDKKLLMAVRFLNAYAKKLQKEPAFEAKHQLGAKPLKAVGKYVREYESVTKKSPMGIVDGVVECMLALGECGSHPAMKTHNKLSEAMRKKVA